MRIREGDSVLIPGDRVAIVLRRKGNSVVCRLPTEDNAREVVVRDKVRPLAELMAASRRNESKFRNNFSLVGKATLGELAERFGYSATSRLRGDTLHNIIGQLSRAGLEISASSELWRYDDTFTLEVLDESSVEQESEPDVEVEDSDTYVGVTLPEPFWPTALGLSPTQEPAFLRALSAREPLLCVLYAPVDPSLDWVRPTWEGIVTWAFQCAQRFPMANVAMERAEAETVRGEGGLLSAYLTPSILSADGPRLIDRPHTLNLVAARDEMDSWEERDRLRACWPGSYFEFDPESPDAQALIQLFALVGGHARTQLRAPEVSPLKTLVWAKDACKNLLAKASMDCAEFLSTSRIDKFKGSNESALALALKAYVGQWAKRRDRNAQIEFERATEKMSTDVGEEVERTRADLRVAGVGVFEVETMTGSGPMEGFLQQKVFARIQRDSRRRDESFNLVVPNDTLLWAGPYLSDLAFRLGKEHAVVFPGSAGPLMRMDPAQSYFEEHPLELEAPLVDQLRAAPARAERAATALLRLGDVAGYADVKRFVEDEVIFARANRSLLSRTSQISGILFFGPPGCGKSRFAKAIAGSLEHEVRLLGPSDLRGIYIGWGQRRIREEFDWLLGNERRMLIIDELDAVARSRRQDGDMHSDEKAEVNELLVQLDRAREAKRLIVATTNYLASLDDAVVRAGRFSLKLPVPPPDRTASSDIVGFYLRQACEPEGDRPSVAEIASEIEQHWRADSSSAGYWSGADLEDAVSRAHRRALRRQLDDTRVADSAPLNIRIKVTPEDLSIALKSAARAVSAEAMAEFRADVHRNCDRDLARKLEAGFPP